MRKLEETFRGVEIQRIIDLQIALNIQQEQERDKLTVQMANPRKYPHESLEYLRRTLLLVLTRRNHSPEEPDIQAQLQPDYIK